MLKRDFQIALETSWPCVYHDLAGDNLHFIRKPVALRTQLKNAAREADKFVPGPPSHHTTNTVQISYNRSTIGDGTVLQGMFAAAGIPGDYADADYRLPVPQEWRDVLDNNPAYPIRRPSTMDHSPLFEGAKAKPMLVYRPLVMRPEWRGSGIRNANTNQYAELITLVRDSFFVVSVADLEANREWIVGPQLKADLELNHGELSFEALAALFSRAALVFTSSGFPAILGPAVGTPTICVQGGFEPASWHADGAKFAPYLGIEPISPCVCATSACTRPCTKLLDMPRARAAITEFSTKLGFSLRSEYRQISEYHAPAAPVPGAAPAPVGPRVMPRVRVGHPSLLAQRRPPVRA